MSHHYIQFEDVRYAYPHGSQALDGINFRINHGERVALLGLNGSGKSTLLLHTNGLLLPDSGRVVVGDVPVTRQTAPQVRQRVGLVFQDPDDMLFMPTIADDIAFGPRNMKLPEDEVERRVEGALEAVGLIDKRDRPSFRLSGGERRRAAIAAVLSMEPDILVLDEPTANLDSDATERLIAILDRFKHTIILATHDMETARRVCKRAITISGGRVESDRPL